MTGYTKLFNSILASTIWNEPHHVRVVWITLLAMADRNGVAEGSVPGLAQFARVTREECDDALHRLYAPDTDSRSKEHQGRRIEAIDGGWQIINHAKYRAKLSADERREYNRVKQAESRQRRSADVKGVNDKSQLSTPSAHTEAEADPKAEPEAKTTKTVKTSPSSPGLLRSPLDYDKKLKTCAYVGARLEIPAGLHANLVRETGGTNADGLLKTLYAEWDSELEQTNGAIFPNVFDWTRAKWQTWMVSAGLAKVPAKPGAYNLDAVFAEAAKLDKGR